jgi:dihydrofolate reductase
MKGHLNMRNIISLAHLSLDGYMAAPDGDFSFVGISDELFAHVDSYIANADTAIYGRTTFQMMEGYWPTAADAPDADIHTKNHARWYKGVRKIVASRTLPASKDPNVTIVGDDIVGALRAAKQTQGGDMMIFASPTLTHTLAAAGLVDEWQLTINPVALGGGLPLFAPQEKRLQLELRSAKTFANGVIAAHYVTKR